MSIQSRYNRGSRHLVYKFHVFQILADNLIERLPMNLGKLQSLKVMTMDGNRLTTLPDECKFS